MEAVIRISRRKGMLLEKAPTVRIYSFEEVYRRSSVNYPRLPSALLGAQR